MTGVRPIVRRYCSGSLAAVAAFCLDLRYCELHWNASDAVRNIPFLNDLVFTRSYSLAAAATALYLLVTAIVMAHRAQLPIQRRVILWLAAAPFISVALIPLLSVT